MTNWRKEFENELHRRGLPFDLDEQSDRYRVAAPNGEALVSIENLQRDLDSDGDLGRVPRFVDAVIASTLHVGSTVTSDSLFWCLEPNDYVEKADIRIAVSDRVDRVLTHLSADKSRLTWVTLQMLASAGISEADASSSAFQNLARELTASQLEFKEIDDVRLGFISTTLPLKSSLLLAPNLREKTQAILGWPLLAVAPDRDFVYLWAEQHKAFVDRIGHVVVREYSRASHPLSTEVYSATDRAFKAVGEFPHKT